MVTERDSLPSFAGDAGKNLQMFPGYPFYQVRRCFSGHFSGAVPRGRDASRHSFAVVDVAVLRGEAGGYLLVFG